MSDDCFRLSPPQSSNTHVGAKHRVIDAVAGPPIDSQFKQAMAEGLAIAEVSSGEPVDSDRNLRLCASVRQPRQPMIEDISPATADVMANFDHSSDCNL